MGKPYTYKVRLEVEITTDAGRAYLASVMDKVASGLYAPILNRLRNALGMEVRIEVSVKEIVGGPHIKRRS